MAFKLNKAERVPTKADSDLAMKIARRARRMYRRRAKGEVFIAFLIMIVHSNVVPLDLERLLTCSDDDFDHDMRGMRDHIAEPYVELFDPLSSTMSLTHGWMPRCAAGAPMTEPLQ